MKIENIVTVDFDIIMAPSIEIYNRLIGEERGINDIAEYGSNLMSYCNADLCIYSVLSFYIFKTFESLKKEQIHFVYEHDQVYNYLEADKKYNVFNIDHHHDCGYYETSELYCGNWVLKMQQNNKLNNYLWICDNNSSDLPDNIGKKITLDRFNLSSLPTPDMLVLCLSEAWVTKQFIPLFILWIDFYNKYFNETSEPIEIEAKNGLN